MIHAFGSRLRYGLWKAARIARDWYFWLGLAALVFAIWFVSLWWMPVLQSGRHLESFFFAYRSLDLVNGVSPELPFLLLAAVLLLLCFLHFRRHALSLETAEKLPSLGEREEGKSIDKYAEMAADPLAHPLLSRQAKGVLLSIMGASFIIFLKWAKPLSLESTEYDLLYNVLFRLVIVLIVLSWARLLLSWFSLRRLLDLLDRHPLKDAFKRIPAIYAASPILPGKRLHIVEDLIRRSINTLDSLMKNRQGEEFRNGLEDRCKKLRETIKSYMPGDSTIRKSDIGTLKAIHNLFRETGELIVGDLLKFWRGNYVELRASKKDNGSSEGRGLSIAANRGEEFVALQYAAFIAMIMQQLRNLLCFVTTGFFLVIVSSLVYPFRSSNQFMWIGTVAFVVLGTPVVLAFIQIERNEGLKRLTTGGEGKITRPFLRFVVYGTLPLLGLVSSHFPALGRYLVSLLQPAMQALR